MKIKIIILIILFVPFCLHSQVHEEWDARYLGANDVNNSISYLTYDNYGNVYVTGQSIKNGGGYVQNRLTVKYNNRGEFQWDAKRDSVISGKIVVDYMGNVIVCGNSNLFGALITKYSSYGGLVWEKRCLNGINDMVIDDFGNIYITGYGANGNGQSGFYTQKYNPAGTLLWTSTYFNYNFNGAERILLDNAGNIYVCGIVGYSGLYTIVVIKYNNNGQQIFWANTSQPTIMMYNSDYVGLSVDKQGNTYTSFPCAGINNKNDILLTKFNSEGREIRYIKFNSTYNLNDNLNYLTTSSNGNVFMWGYSQTDTNYNYKQRIFCVKYDSTGQLKSEKYFDTTSSYCIISDSNSFYLNTAKSINNANFVRTMKIDTLGNLKWQIDYWGVSASNINTINNDNYGNIYIAGNTINTQYPAFLTVRYLQSLNNVSTVTGCVKFENNNLPVSGGYVKAFRYDNYSGNLIKIDSSVIQVNGYYSLKNISQDSLYIIAYPSSSLDFVPAFFPSGIRWQNAIKIYTTTNLSDVNISVPSLNQQSGNITASGYLYSFSNKSFSQLSDGIIYAVSGNNFIGFGTSSFGGHYEINSLPSGNIKFIATRVGYAADSLFKNLYPSSNTDSLNFYLNKISVGINNLGKITPDKFKLYQNYPNPFNPTTNIKYQIAKSCLVKLKVYDNLGREVAALVNEYQKTGVYEVQFPGNLAVYGKLSSGIYFYKLETENFTEVKRMVLIK